MCAKRQNGSSESWVYLESLDNKMQKKLAVIFQRMADFGALAENRFKMLEDSDGISEFRCDEHRLLCFHDGPVWILTHGFPKSGQKTPKGQIARAKTIRAEYIALKKKFQENSK
jgi:phage-related protein